MSDDTQNRGTEPTLYFGYGSNIWIDQMNRRCPDNKYIGLGVLHEWCWIINQNGYATIVPSPGDYVYGFIYEISSKDEQSLDIYEAVPDHYEKRIVPLKLITGSGDGKSTVNALVYIDVTRTNRDLPKTEYIYRINTAIKDALQKGIPQFYVDKYIRPFIPPE